MPWITLAGDWHPGRWSTALGFIGAAALPSAQRSEKELPAALLRSLPVVALAPPPGSLQLSGLGTLQRTSISPTCRALAPGKSFHASQPLAPWGCTHSLRVPGLPRPRKPVTLSHSRCSIRCSFLIADDQHDQKAELSPPSQAV